MSANVDNSDLATLHRELERVLRAEVRGEVAFDTMTRAMYARDASIYRQIPIGVITPLDINDVAQAVEVSRRFAIPVLPRGTGTSLAGQAVNSAVVIDMRKLNRIIEINPQARTARVESGVLLDSLNAAGKPYGLRVGPDPSTHNRCTIGGMIGNNACGTRSVAWGRTDHAVIELDILLYDGTKLRVGSGPDFGLSLIEGSPERFAGILRDLRGLQESYLHNLRIGFPDLPRRGSGYSLDELLPERGQNCARALVGTEGTCCIVLSAQVRLVEVPPEVTLIILGYPDLATAADQVPTVLMHDPVGLEGLSRELLESVRNSSAAAAGLALLPEGRAWLLVELSGNDAAEVAAKTKRAVEALGIAGPATDWRAIPRAEDQALIWRVREDASGLASRTAEGSPAWPGWEDAAVPPARLGAYIREFQDLLDRHGLHGIPYGHFGDGCIHVRINFDLESKSGRQTYRAFVEQASDLVVRHGGSLSGEHGDGQARGELLARMYPAELLGAFRAFKKIWDPEFRMNPGKIIDSNPLDADLGPSQLAEAGRPRTTFALSQDRGDFRSAVGRCVGVGKCLRPHGGSMCPSYKATSREEDSTRGRARLLAEMLDGNVVKDGWRSEEVLASLDLCLGCKACVNECPVSVDMATYKAEFLSHHYQGRLRPRTHYTLGHLPTLVRFGMYSPSLANSLIRIANRSGILRSALGIAPQRVLPSLATRTLQDKTRSADSTGRQPVVIFPDTFTNYFSPQIGQAAIDVLKWAGFEPIIPSGKVCCGLTWVSTGQLEVARRVMQRTANALSQYVKKGVPVVVLEPSCNATLKHDLPELVQSQLSNDLSRLTTTIGALLEPRIKELPPMSIRDDVIAQVHCHQQAVLGGYSREQGILEAAGASTEIISTGCCGLAGNFGFESRHYGISMRCAEEVLGPALRSSASVRTAVADGFSCRIQIEHLTGQRALHWIEVMARNLPATNVG